MRGFPTGRGPWGILIRNSNYVYAPYDLRFNRFCGGAFQRPNHLLYQVSILIRLPLDVDHRVPNLKTVGLSRSIELHEPVEGENFHGIECGFDRRRIGRIGSPDRLL